MGIPWIFLLRFQTYSILRMAEKGSFSPTPKRQKVVDQLGPNFDMEFVRSENKALKEEVAELKVKVSELEKKLEEKTPGRNDTSTQTQVVWELCSEHEWMFGLEDIPCSLDEDRKSCPFYYGHDTTFEDLINKIPDVVEAIFKYLDIKSAVSCRRVNKTWKSFVHHNLKDNLYAAVGVGDIASVERLIAGGANVNGRLMDTRYKYIDTGKSPLHIAATSSLEQHIGIGKLLIDAGAELDVRDGDCGVTPLYRASEGGDHSKTFLKMLLDAGADIEGTADEMTDTPLIAAITSIGEKTCAIDNMKILLDAGTNVNFRDSDGKTPLHFLISHLSWLGFEEMNQFLESVDILLAAGANKWARNRAGRTPLEHAIHYRCSTNNKLSSSQIQDEEKALEKLREILHRQGHNT